jgi:hypothetical protein
MTMMNAKRMDGQMQARLQARALLGQRVEGDRLVLDDATLRAALDGSRPLRSAERDALQASPLTARRLRQLALERRAAAAGAGAGAQADAAAESGLASDLESGAAWRGSRGMLRAASSGGAPAPITTDDGCWTLHLVAAGGGGWRTILQLAPDAPFAAALLAERAPLQVRDALGRILLEGRLDADGECEAPWPLAAAPAAHLQANGAVFTVTPHTVTPSC